MPSEGPLDVRIVGGTTYVALPSALGVSVGTTGTWTTVSPALLERLPAALTSAIEASSDELVWIVAELEGAGPTTQPVGTRSVAGSTDRGFAAVLSPSLAAARVPQAAPAMTALEALLSTPAIQATAWIAPTGLVAAESLGFSLRQPTGPALAVHAAIDLSAYGAPVSVPVPSTSPLGPPPTSTTTTSVPVTLPTTTLVPTSTTFPFPPQGRAARPGRG